MFYILGERERKREWEPELVLFSDGVFFLFLPFNISDSTAFKCEVDCLSESVLADCHHISKIKERIENNQLSEELKPPQYVSD